MAEQPYPARAARRAPARRITLPLLAALAMAACGGGGNGATSVPLTPPDTLAANQYRNPVLNADFPDPGVVHASDGYYYAYATQTTGYRLQVSRSRDLVSWSAPGEALPSKPAWASQSNNFWAPDVEERSGQFVMYFAAQVDAARRTNPGDGFCIGMATATSALGPFTDVGHPVVCGPNANVIDPQGFDDPQSGRRYLYWGSGGAPIMVQELAADRASFAAGSAPIALLSPRNDGGYDQGLIEGPWVMYHAPYYYLMFSGNNCCGAGAHYAVMVARSSSPTGPFEELTDAGGAAQPILQGNGTWQAPGHNSVITDAAGNDWMLYHAVDPTNPYLIPGNTAISRRVLMLDRITWVNGWPTVGAGGTPTSTAQTKPTTSP